MSSTSAQPANARSASARCVHCQQPLTTLAHMRGLTVCEAPACRTKDSLATLDRRWRRVGLKALEKAAQHRAGDGAPLLLLWLEPTGSAQVPVEEADRQYLASRWRRAWNEGINFDFEGADTQQELPAAANALCAHCGGRCCTYGGSQAAFVGTAELRRWMEGHPGSTLEDAISAYLAWLPAEHAQGQCTFQARQGCTLPRELRSDVCNRYRCDALEQLGAAATRDPQVAAVVLTKSGRHLESAAVFERGQARPLTGVPSVDDFSD